MKLDVPGIDKSYWLLQNDLLKCPQKTERTSCLLDDWAEAINEVVRDLEAKEKEAKNKKRT